MSQLYSENEKVFLLIHFNLNYGTDSLPYVCPSFASSSDDWRQKGLNHFDRIRFCFAFMFFYPWNVDLAFSIFTTDLLLLIFLSTIQA